MKSKRSGNIPANRKHTEEILHHHRRVDELTQLVELPLEADLRRRVVKAIREEADALCDSYYAECEHVLDRWGRCIGRM